MLHYINLEQELLHSHVARSCNKLLVISGYVGSEIVRELDKFPKDTQFTIVYGMYGCDNISEPLHKKLVELHKKLENVEILYSTVPIHSKIYCWSYNDVIKSTMIGSANFTINGLRRNYKETLYDVHEESIPEYIEYFKYVLDRSLPCTDKSITLKKQRHIDVGDNIYATQPFISEGICRASLLSRGKEVAEKSGLNWGLSPAHVSPGDAYIAITKEYIKYFPSLFPSKKYVNGIQNVDSKGKANRENDEVELIWDDGTSMIGLMEGQQTDDNGLIYPKQLSSSPSKNIIGQYIRKRLGILKADGSVDNDYRITRADLIKYGRSHIDISLIGEGIYYMDFSV